MHRTNKQKKIHKCSLMTHKTGPRGPKSGTFTDKLQQARDVGERVVVRLQQMEAGKPLFTGALNHFLARRYWENSLINVFALETNVFF